jgi:hypothetical protein
MINSKVTNDATALEALLGRDGQPIQNFPATTAQIHELDSTRSDPREKKTPI